MPALPPVSALWVGGALSWLERLCLTSFAEIGHPVRLYAYEPVSGVPEGVEVRDGRAVAGTEFFVRHERSGSLALFSDLFRFRLMLHEPGAIWVDTDVYCLRPLAGLGPHVFGYEQPGRLNGAVLALPPESEALRLMLDLTADPYAIPEFYPAPARAEMARRKAEGNPMHASEMSWGVWGPQGLTWSLHKTGEARFARAEAVFYPSPFPVRAEFFKRPTLTLRRITDETLTVHLWGRIKRIAGKRHEGLAPPGSYLGVLLAKHGIDPADYPVREHGRFSFGDDEED